MEKRIGDVVGVLIERHDTLLARLGRENHYFVDDSRRAHRALEENFLEVRESRQKRARRRIDQHCARGFTRTIKAAVYCARS